ncbi:DNA adenine methylase [Pedobacter glucosidilyticus]|uniref:DNA adenine methylase n=1 Tax=Pedobacter glucosidilyticus TaxID=1122941 RepID=UPI000420BFB9|nr:DNA adenine methylase [Pedobacter glucosidilyticus]
MANPRNQSPLRYPGGKACLTPFITQLATLNEVNGGTYIELYAGGAGAALNLLYNGVFNSIHINDYDYSIYSFWHSILNETDAFIELIENTPITLEEWYRQKAIFSQGRHNEQLILGFATFYLNRTNRSGIIFKAGPIGGYEQQGNYLIDVRFNKKELINRIRKVASFASKIHLTNNDAIEIIRDINQIHNNLENSFLYLDPPYYYKGKQLYLNNYGHEGHQSLAAEMSQVNKDLKWLISYDNASEIIGMYPHKNLATFNLNYTLQEKRFGSELLIFSDNLTLEDRITVNGRESQLQIFRHEPFEPAY